VTCAVRVDGEGEPRLLAVAPDLDDLIGLGFDQVSAMVVDEQPVLAARLVVWLEELERAAVAAGAPVDEVRRHLERLRPTAARLGPAAREELPAVRTREVAAPARSAP
jgi:hypothetical protein